MLRQEQWLKAGTYRQRAKRILAEAQTAKDEITKRKLLAFANAWLELARRAEELENS